MLEYLQCKEQTKSNKVNGQMLRSTLFTVAVDRLAESEEGIGGGHAILRDTESPSLRRATLMQRKADDVYMQERTKEE